MAQTGGRAQRHRLHALSAIFVGFGLLLAYRLTDLQVLQHDRFIELAREEHFPTFTVPARRGILMDTNGQALAISVPYDSVQISGGEIRNPDTVASQLAPLLELTPDEIRAKIEPQSKVLVPIKSRLPSAQAAQVAGLRLLGVYLKPEPARLYPEGSIAPQVLGIVGQDSHGL